MALVTPFNGKSRETEVKVYNVGRENNLRPDKKPVIIKWNDHLFALPPLGGFFVVKGNDAPRIARIITENHVGLSLTPPQSVAAPYVAKPVSPDEFAQVVAEEVAVEEKPVNKKVGK